MHARVCEIGVSCVGMHVYWYVCILVGRGTHSRFASTVHAASAGWSGQV